MTCLFIHVCVHKLPVTLLLATCSEATEFSVSTDGDDNNQGKLETPWRHVQKASTVLTPSDICTISGGEYSEEVKINGMRGSKRIPITIRSNALESVTSDGTIPVTSSWEKYEKLFIYVTPLEGDSYLEVV